MWFFIIIGAVFALVLLAAWSYDRKQKRRGHPIRDVNPSRDDAAVGEAKSMLYTRVIQGLGGGGNGRG
jgi:hypothetical protein